MRIYAIYSLTGLLTIYAWRDWFKSLCGLILMMAVMNHEDMPKSIMGIQGLNLWNILFVSVFLAWLSHRRAQGLRWDLPRHIRTLLLIYLGIVLVGVLRALMDRTNISDYNISSMLSEELINTIKWAIPGLLLYDGCRDRLRLKQATACLLALYVILAAQVIRRMPFSSALGGGGPRIQRIRLKVCSSIGYSAVDMSVILAGASWALLACLPLVRKKRHRAALIALALATAFGQALTGGRAGYLAWGAIGLILCLLRWRKFLLVAPVVVAAIWFAFPGTVERALTGVSAKDAAGQRETDEYHMTSGRNLIWPHVIDKIGEGPVFGYGRLAMKRTGLTKFLRQQYGDAEAFPHPHNVYLECLLDNGLIGTIPVLMFFGLIVWYSARLFRAQEPWCTATGGIAMSLVLAQLIAGIGSQHFYPRESTVGVWVAMFMVIRMNLARSPAMGHAAVPAAGLGRTPQVAFASGGYH